MLVRHDVSRLKSLDRITAPSKRAAETPGRALNRLSRAQSPRRSERPSTADRVSTEPDTEEPSAVTKGLMASFGGKETENAKETEKASGPKKKLEDGSTVRTQSVVADGGTTETQEVVRPDGTIERTTSETQAAEESFEELTGAERGSPRKAARAPRSRTRRRSSSTPAPSLPPKRWSQTGRR